MHVFTLLFVLSQCVYCVTPPMDNWRTSTTLAEICFTAGLSCQNVSGRYLWCFLQPHPFKCAKSGNHFYRPPPPCSVVGRWCQILSSVAGFQTQSNDEGAVLFNKGLFSSWKAKQSCKQLTNCFLSLQLESVAFIVHSSNVNTQCTYDMHILTVLYVCMRLCRAVY